jgi:hypothetical protein
LSVLEKLGVHAALDDHRDVGFVGVEDAHPVDGLPRWRYCREGGMVSSAADDTEPCSEQQVKTTTINQLGVASSS